MSPKRQRNTTAGNSTTNRDQERTRRDWWVFLLILLFGFLCLLITAHLAVRPARVWQVSANMFSELNPDEMPYTGDERIEPIRPEVMTRPPWDPRLILTPMGTAVVVLPGTLMPILAGSPTPGEVAIVPSPSPSVTFSPSPTPSPTPTGTPTSTPTPTSTSTSTSTPTPTTTPTPTATATSTATPTPTPTPYVPPPPTTETPPTHTPTSTHTPTPTPVPAPVILSITPNQGVNSVPVTVTITGANFMGVPTTTLGANIPIAISAATTDTLTGTVPAGLVPAVYALRVTNPDGQSAILSPAYIVLDPDTTVQTGLVSTFGTAATSPQNGDNDQVQVIFFEIPDTVTDTLYTYIFDPDVGSDFDEQREGSWNTATSFSLYGGSGAYTDPAARQSWFATITEPGISSGTPIISQTFAVSDTLSGTWYLFATLDPAQGEAVGSRRIFKLAVVGANSGDDGNLYNVALSTSNSSPNEAPTGGRIFAYSWTLPLDSSSVRRLYPYVPVGTRSFEQHNWDMDGTCTMALQTPIRSLSGSISADNAEASSAFGVDSSEDGATWTVTMAFVTPGVWNDLTFWGIGDGIDLPIFTRPTMIAPP